MFEEGGVSKWQPPEIVNGPANPSSRLRLFGHSENDVRVIFYRDHHAWCPYCQKIWIWLEAKRIPYRVNKVTMFCYGNKEAWYTTKVSPKGMLPAVTIDGEIILDSDHILAQLEEKFGVLNGRSILDEDLVKQRELERKLFGSWCDWLCRPNDIDEEKAAKLKYQKLARKIEEQLEARSGPFFFGDKLSVSDIVLVPFIERMCASLFYFKGYEVRTEHPAICKFVNAFTQQDCYKGTQSDYHTHVHGLPPQMGACYFTNGYSWDKKPASAMLVDNGPFTLVGDVPEIDDTQKTSLFYDAACEAAYRVEKHWERIGAINAYAHSNGDDFDIAMRY